MSGIECSYSLLKHRLCLFKVTPIRVSLHELHKHKSYSHVQHRCKHSETQTPIWASCIIPNNFHIAFVLTSASFRFTRVKFKRHCKDWRVHTCVFMVRTILKRSWILLVVLKSPWIRFRSLKSTWFLYWVLKSPWNSQPCLSKTPFPVKLDFFAKGNSAHPRCKNLYNSRVLLKHFWAWTILRFCFFVSNAISVPQIQLQLIPSQVLMQKVV